jgi:H+-transporting ATPase
MTTRTDLSPVLDAVRVSRRLFQRLRIGFIYAGALTVRTVLCFSLLSFVYKIDFSPFAIILVALATNIAILALTTDRAVSGTKPARWDLTEIFIHSTAYGVYLALSTCVHPAPFFRSFSCSACSILFVHIVLKTTIFERRLGLSLSAAQLQHDDQLHTLIYLQVVQISHALLFFLPSERFSSRRPLKPLLSVFCLGQLSSSIIAAYGNWGFANMHAVSGPWIGLIWVWVGVPHLWQVVC